MTHRLLHRAAHLHERQTLESLQRRASLANPGDREAILANPDAIELPDEQLLAGQAWVAERDGEILGFTVVLPRPDGEAELDGLFVEPTLWRGGVGRALVDEAAKQARALGAGYLHVVGNPHAAAFYRRVGFEHIGTSETRFGPALLMRRPV